MGHYLEDDIFGGCVTCLEIRITRTKVIIGKSELNVTILTCFLPKKIRAKENIRKHQKNKKKEEKISNKKKKEGKWKF